MRVSLILTAFHFLALIAVHAASIEGRVLKVLSDTRSFELELTQSADAKLKLGSTHIFRVGSGDLIIGYQGRKIKANAAYYGKQWHLEQIFPIDGLGAKAAHDVNHQLHQATAAKGHGLPARAKSVHGSHLCRQMSTEPGQTLFPTEVPTSSKFSPAHTRTVGLRLRRASS